MGEAGLGLQIICDDVVQWAATYAGPPMHALICDPPYELNFMSRGWDNTGVAFRPATWRALAQHLLPGAFVMAFASSRGYHRLACALEDAGLIIHPAIGWVQASGWPKATRIDTTIDYEAGAEREVLGTRIYADGTKGHWAPSDKYAQDTFTRVQQTGACKVDTAPATPLAQAWAGHRYGLQALKPALEFIAVAQVPYRNRSVDSITQTGAGALWIDGGRIGTANTQCHGTAELGYHGKNTAAGYDTGSPCGRWPPNLALCHMDRCQPLGPRQVRGSGWDRDPADTAPPSNSTFPLAQRLPRQGYAAPDGTETVEAWSCDPACPIGRLDAQAGDLHGAGYTVQRDHPSRGNHEIYGHGVGGAGDRYGDTGPASRFFPCFDWSLDVAEQLAQADPIRYCAKASQAERSNGLPGRNPHPTIKPLALCTWLATLLLPPVAYAPRRLLIPFAGTGSECIGAARAGWDMILGIEQDPATVQTARQRLTYWTGASFPVEPVPEAAVAVAPVPPPGQLSLF